MNFLPLPDGSYLLTGEGRTKSEIGKFSVSDAERFDAYTAHLEAVANTLRALMLRAPPNVVNGFNARSLREFGRLISLGNTLRGHQP